MGSIPGLGSSPGEGNGNPLQCARLENSMGRGSLQAIVHGSWGHSDWEHTHKKVLDMVARIFELYSLYNMAEAILSVWYGSFGNKKR